jgi:hypothetical protein
VVGTVVGGGYSYPRYSTEVGYGYVQHSCHWYYNNEPYHIPSSCRSYSYSYGAPSYVVSNGYSTGGYGVYWHGHHRHYASNGSWRPWREVVTTSQVRVTRTSGAATSTNHARITTATPAHVNVGERHMAAVHGAAGAHLAQAGGHVKVH